MAQPLWRSCCLLAALGLVAWSGASGLLLAQAPASATPRFELADGDRVVLLGSTFIERDGSHGYLETAFSSRFHPRRIQFRNLGWSGDNVFGEARAGFGSVADGFAQLKKHVLALEPTVILLNYGANESFAGQAGLASFQQGLETLLAALDESKARIVFLTPPPQENLGPPLPDPAEHNRDLKLYGAAIAAVAKKRGELVLNLFDALGKLQPPPGGPLTDNGIHLTDYGYWRATPAIEEALGLEPRAWQIEIDAPRQNIGARGVTISQARFAENAVEFKARDGQLPLPPAPPNSPEAARAISPRVVSVFGLPKGRYALKIDGQEVATASAAQWLAGVTIASGPDFNQAEQLRRTILDKNQLYFHRWRPQNETYLFGFRKHEQGQNAVEIPQFDPLVAAREQTIAELCAPVERHYQLLRVDAQ